MALHEGIRACRADSEGKNKQEKRMSLTDALPTFRFFLLLKSPLNIGLSVCVRACVRTQPAGDARGASVCVLEASDAALEAGAEARRVAEEALGALRARHAPLLRGVRTLPRGSFGAARSVRCGAKMSVGSLVGSLIG